MVYNSLLALLVAGRCILPPVKLQTINADGFSIQSHNGLYDFIITTAGPTTTAVVKKDGVQVATVALSTPTAAQLQTQLNVFLTNQFGDQMICQAHVFSVSPLLVKLISSNLDSPIPANWWSK